MKCHCGSSKEFSECCEPLLKGQREALTPEELMRSRYSAFVTKDMNYIFETTDPQTRTQFDMKANEEWAETAQFLKLEVLNSLQEGNKGVVEFKATFKAGSQPEQVHHEISKFRKQSGTWYFREGKVKS